MTDLPAPSAPPEVSMGGDHIWHTLGYRRTAWSAGSTTLEWDATEAYGFPTRSGHVIQGGLVTALLDAAMGGACWSLMDDDQAFLTADLRVEFLRSTRPGTIHSTGMVVRRTRRVVFCAAELFDAAGTLLAVSRCTQVVLPDEGTAGRAEHPTGESGPPQDARG